MGDGPLTLEITFNRPSKVYSTREELCGLVSIFSKTEVKHDGIVAIMEGALRLELSAKHVGVMQALSTTKPTTVLCGDEVNLCEAGILKSGKTELPFKFKLEPIGSKNMFETYHGLCIAVQYAFKCEIKRTFPNKSVSKSAEFLMQNSPNDNYEKAVEKVIAFTIAPSTGTNKENRATPSFNMTGQLDTWSCCLSRPLTGHVTVHSCPDAQIHSIDLKLVRVETVGGDQGGSRDLSEVQTTQIGVGDVCKGLEIPIYMFFPRLFACPTLCTPNFKIEFELWLQISFGNDKVIIETFPLTLHRF